MGVDVQAVKDQIRDHILRVYLPGEDASNLQDDTPLKSSGILDSVSTLKLVTFVEETWSIEVSPHEASSEFDRIEDIAALVQSKAA
jgi:acyl carrier protein